MNIKKKIRFILWRLLGIDYAHIMRVVDEVYLKESNSVKSDAKSYDNHAKIYSWGDAGLIVGKYCSISYDVRFILDDGKHQYNIITSYPFENNRITYRGGIVVGNDVWIGMGVIILPGVKIGDGATIAAGSVVTKDVAPYTIVGGVPAKLIREKCTRHQAQCMQQIAWWNWDEEDIKNNHSDFKLSFNDFIAKHAIRPLLVEDSENS